MLNALSSSSASLLRQLRLLRRHLRYGPPGCQHFGHAARMQALTTLYCGVNTYLRELGVDYWLVYGTLLGWHREGRILAHDADVDFGAPVDCFDRIWAARHRLPAGFTLYDTSHRHLGPKLYCEYRGWEADLYFYREAGGKLWSTERSPNPGDTKPFPRSFFYPRQPATFLGEPTWVPAQTIAYLEHTYAYIGPDAVRNPVTRYFEPRRRA
jgi:hypothetical protein